MLSFEIHVPIVPRKQVLIAVDHKLKTDVQKENETFLIYLMYILNTSLQPDES